MPTGTCRTTTTTTRGRGGTAAFSRGTSRRRRSRRSTTRSSTCRSSRCWRRIGRRASIALALSMPAALAAFLCTSSRDSSSPTLPRAAAYRRRRMRRRDGHDLGDGHRRARQHHERVAAGRADDVRPVLDRARADSRDGGRIPLTRAAHRGSPRRRSRPAPSSPRRRLPWGCARAPRRADRPRGTASRATVRGLVVRACGRGRHRDRVRSLGVRAVEAFREARSFLTATNGSARPGGSRGAVPGRSFGPHGVAQWLAFPFELASPPLYRVAEVAISRCAHSPDLRVRARRPRLHGSSVGRRAMQCHHARRESAQPGGSSPSSRSSRSWSGPRRTRSTGTCCRSICSPARSSPGSCGSCAARASPPGRRCSCRPCCSPRRASRTGDA